MERDSVWNHFLSLKDFFTKVSVPIGFHAAALVITSDCEVIMFSPCVFIFCVYVCLCLSRCLSGRFNYEDMVPHKHSFAGIKLEMSSGASYVPCTCDVIDDITRSHSWSNSEIDISPSVFQLEGRSKAQIIENSRGYLAGIFKYRYHYHFQ